jgi:hypothetical protein
MAKQQKSIYDKLNYVPLPNLKESLKKFLKTGDETFQVDKLLKSTVISKFKSLSLTEKQIDEIYSQYRYGGRLSFQFLYSFSLMQNKNILIDLQKFEFPNQTEDTPYEKLLPVKDLVFIDETYINETTLEIGFKYSSLYKYINVSDNEEPSHIYETHYGFLWINFEESYLVLITKDEKINKQIIKAFKEGLEISLATPKLTKTIINRIFPKYKVRSASFAQETGTTYKISFAKEISDDPIEQNKLEELEKTGDRKSAARYNEKISDDSSVISINSDKSKITILKIFSTEEIRNWGLSKFKEISDEIKNIKTTNIDDYFNIFEKKYFETRHFNKDEKDLIKLICAGIYNSIGNKSDNEFDLSKFDFLTNKIKLNKFFRILPFYTCTRCEMEHSATCYHCDALLIWNENEKSLQCKTCKKSYNEQIFIKCVEDGTVNEYSIGDCLTLIPTYLLIEIVSEFMENTDKNFNDKAHFFYINNSVLYFRDNAPSVEIQLTSLSQFKDLNLNLRLQDNETYKKLKTDTINLKEKCDINPKTIDCDNCVEFPERSCLMKMFKYIEPTFRLEPHKVTEYGDASFPTELNGENFQVKFIMKSTQGTKETNITAGNSLGKDILGQVMTQYMRDSYSPILGILATPGIDRYLREDIIRQIKYKKGKVVFIEEQQLISLLQLAKQKGFQV